MKFLEVKNPKIFYAFDALVVAIIVATVCRGILLINSWDFLNYRNWYETIASKELSQGWLVHGDKGYVLLNYLFSHFFKLSFLTFVKIGTITIQCLCLYPLFKLKNKVDGWTYISLILIFFLNFFDQEHLSHYFRQNLAISFILFAMAVPRGITFIVFTLLATSVHLSSAVYVFVPALVDIFQNYKEKKEFWGWSLYALLLNGLYLVINYLNLTRYTRATRGELEPYFEGEILTFWVLILVFIIFLIRDNASKYLWSYQDRLRWASIVVFWILVKFLLIKYYNTTVRWNHYAALAMVSLVNLSLPLQMNKFQRIVVVGAAILSCVYSLSF